MNLDDDIFKQEILNSIKVLENGGILLYPTDTIWGIGCDATNKKAVDCVEMMHKGAERVQAQLAGMTREEQLAYWERSGRDLLELQQQAISRQKAV